MVEDIKLSIESVIPDKLDLDKSIYRSRIKSKEKFNCRVIYRYSDLLISSDKDISTRIKKPLKEIYSLLESFAESNPYFFKSLSPVKIRSHFPPIIKKMCEKSAIYNVGPMATVAGAVSEYLAENCLKYCRRLLIENGGDLYIKTNKEIIALTYVKNKYFKDKIKLKIPARKTSFGLCSSSGSLGHSLSMGKSDLVVVLADSVVSADAAATSIANSINGCEDIERSINHYKKFKDIKGILIIKDQKAGLWGDIELCV